MQSINHLVGLAVGKRTLLLEQMAKAKKKTLQGAEESAHELVQLLQQETKKRKYATMINLIKVMKFSFVDSETCMRRLHEAGFAAALVDVLKALKNVNQGRWLEVFLTNLADLAEWDLFPSQFRKALVEEVLAVIERRLSDCDPLATEAMSVVTAIFSSNAQGTLSDMQASTTCIPKMLHIAYNIPKMKSFHLQALLVEFVYRVLRLLRKGSGKKEQDLVASLLQKLPSTLSKWISEVTAKQFRQGTRDILNQFNREVGVVTTFALQSIVLEGSGKTRITASSAPWIDIGGLTCEVELQVPVKAEDAQGLLKLHANDIDGYHVHTGSGITMIVKPTLSLADVIPNVNDAEWGLVKGVSVVFEANAQALADLEKALCERFGPPKSTRHTVPGQLKEGRQVQAKKNPSAFYNALASAQENEMKTKDAEPSRKEDANKSKVMKATKNAESSREIKAEYIASGGSDELTTKRLPMAPMKGQGKRSIDQVEPTTDHRIGLTAMRHPDRRAPSVKKLTSASVGMVEVATRVVARKAAASPPHKRMKVEPETQQQAPAQKKVTSASNKIETMKPTPSTRRNVQIKEEVLSEPVDKAPPTRSSTRLGRQRATERRFHHHKESRYGYDPQGDEQAQQSSLPHVEQHPNHEYGVSLDGHDKRQAYDRNSSEQGIITGHRSTASAKNTRSLASETTGKSSLTTLIESMQQFSNDFRASNKCNSGEDEPQDAEERCIAWVPPESPTSSQTSDTSSSMSLDPEPDGCHYPSKETMHVIAVSPKPNVPLTRKPICGKHEVHGSAKTMEPPRSKLDPQETQRHLLSQLKLLGDAVLAEQDAFRESKIEALCRHGFATLKTQASKHVQHLQSRMSTDAIESSLGVTLKGHRDTMDQLAGLQDAVSSHLDTSDTAEDELLQGCFDLKHTVLETLRIKWQDQLRPAQKKSDACRSTRGRQMHNKLQEISTKFNTSDLHAMQAMLGRI
ncbi:hypothetical protein SDRG_06340 [Saprolegnia diclina VS20]|uniref:Uncharacterized protein n=1 Tax=Saprolegnia diclina (strain VS20) TaxID=1156394 RepID=T0RUT3_SAPDV|nr:hypothetical protein SDRG_06340 [Saprolegnia diclina VS20]EQC36233.1 hypothetical protein SDRG_06340 [Saprolegnia diclina VS20]|eukprot:XP_008610339.1 hypothetical protein SDRG_06340 [Saprolegnia diclina VS20]